MNIWEVSVILKKNPGTAAVTVDANLSFRIFYNINKEAICHTKYDTPFILTSNVIEADWEIEDQEVDFMTAFNAWQNDDKIVYSENKDDNTNNYYHPKEKSTSILPEEIKYYKWYIKHK